MLSDNVFRALEAQVCYFGFNFIFNYRDKEVGTILLRNPNGSHAHATSDAHAGYTHTLVSALEFVEQSRDLSAAGVAQRVTAGKTN